MRHHVFSALLLAIVLVSTPASACLAFRGLGEACDLDADIHCEPYLRCVAGTCGHSVEGTTCTEGTISVCGGRGFDCVDGKCTFMRQYGDTCARDAQCASNVCGGDGTCTAVPSGGACVNRASNPCGHNQFCSSVTNTCVDKLATGLDCTDEMVALWKPGEIDAMMTLDICRAGQCEATGGGSFVCTEEILKGEVGDHCGPLRTSHCNLNKDSMVCQVPLVPTPGEYPPTGRCEVPEVLEGGACTKHRDCRDTICECNTDPPTTSNGTCVASTSAGCTSEQTSYLLCVVTRGDRCHGSSLLDTYQGWRWGPEGTCSGICANEALQWNCCQTRTHGTPFFAECTSPGGGGDDDDESSSAHAPHVHALVVGAFSALLTAALMARR